MEFNFDVISADAHVTSMNLRIAREACVMAAVGVSACAICASTVATAERRLRSLSESQASILKDLHSYMYNTATCRCQWAG